MKTWREIKLANDNKNDKKSMGGNNMFNSTANNTNGMNELQKVFNYKGQQVRTVIIDGEPWWVAKDVCHILEISRGFRVVERLDEDEVRKTYIIDSIGRKQEVYIVNEPGLYSLIIRSNKPEAKAFKRWITHEVIPSIRKTGAYGMPDAVKEYLAMSEEDRGIAFFTKQKQVKFLEAENKILKPKAGKYDDFLNSDGLFDWDAVSSILNIGRNTMLHELREKGYLHKSKGNNWNLALRRYEEAGWFVTKAVSSWIDKYEFKIPKYKTFVTPIGLDKLIELFKRCS